MRFGELLNSAQLATGFCRGDAEVTGVLADSRQCRRGSCFVAVRGSRDDGHAYIASAVDAGAAAVVCQDPASVPAGVTCATVTDTRSAIGRLSQAYRGWPARSLVNIGVTGTNGKTTVTHLIRAILAAAGHEPAMLGTISYETGGRCTPAGTTTPDPVSLAEMTAEMVRAGKTHLVMEVSSHALDQKRVAGIDFWTVVFTNLSGDHLDYHKTMERYTQAKCRLFENLTPGCVAVINRDDPAGELFASAAGGRSCGMG